MQREHTRLYTKAHKHQRACPHNHSITCSAVCHRIYHVIHFQRTYSRLQKEKSHKGSQTAEHRKAHIRLGRIYNLFSLIMYNKHIRSKRHYLKEYKGCIQVGRKENTHSSSQGPQHKHIISVSVPALQLIEIFPGNNCSKEPYKSRKYGHYSPKAVTS